MQFSLYANLHSQTYGILLWLLNLQRLVILVHMSFLQLNDIESMTFGTWLFSLAVLVWLIRSEQFRSGPLQSGDILFRLWNLVEIFNVHILMQTYLNQRELLFKKLRKWSKIQQLISINIWFTLSSGSKLNHCRHFAIKYKFFKVTITIQI